MKNFRDSIGNYNILLTDKEIQEFISKGEFPCIIPLSWRHSHTITLYTEGNKSEYEKKCGKWLKEEEIDLCAICGDLTRNNVYYAGNTPICSQKCLTEWDEDHENKDSEN